MSPLFQLGEMPGGRETLAAVQFLAAWQQSIQKEIQQKQPSTGGVGPKCTLVH